jgi:hypothetical protein
VKAEEFLELQFEKFALRVPKGHWYAGYDTWVRVEGDEALVGVTDFFQTSWEISFISARLRRLHSNRTMSWARSRASKPPWTSLCRPVGRCSPLTRR